MNHAMRNPVSPRAMARYSLVGLLTLTLTWWSKSATSTNLDSVPPTGPSTALGNTALGNTALGNTALGNTALGNTALGPGVPSSAPTEWQTALPVVPTRVHGTNAQSCAVRRLNDWYSIRCMGFPISAITHLGGDPAGVEMRLEPAGDDGLPRGGELLFPLQHEQQHVFSFWTLGDGYDGPLTVIAAVVVQADFSDRAPVLLLHDALNEPVRTAQGMRRQQSQGTTSPATNKPQLPPNPPKSSP